MIALRVGVVGLGRVGEVHVRNLQRSGLVSSLVVHDLDGGRARAIADELGADTAPSFPELLRRDVDAVVVATSTHAHAGLVMKAVHRHLPVFCEKPVATSLEMGGVMAALADEHDVPVQVGFQRRCDPELLALRARLHEGRTGRLIGLRIVSTSWQPPTAEYLRSAGGFFMDKLVHDIDVVRWLTGREVEVVSTVASGAATGWIGKAGDVDTVSAGLELAGGLVAQVWSSRVSPTRFEFRIDAVTERASLLAGNWADADPSDRMRRQSPFPTFLARFADAYAAEMRAFCALVGGTGENICPVADAMLSERAAAAAHLAWRERRAVRLAEFDAGPPG